MNYPILKNTLVGNIDIQRDRSIFDVLRNNIQVQQEVGNINALSTENKMIRIRTKIFI